MKAKVSILTTCTITLATALTNLTPLEVRAMEGSKFTSNQEEISQATSTSVNKWGICIWIPGRGWVGDCPWLSNH